MPRKGKKMSLEEFLASGSSSGGTSSSGGSSGGGSSSSSSSGSAPSPTLFGLLAKHYGPLPGPCRATMDMAAKISGILQSQWNVDTSRAGIVAVAQTASNAFHVGFSPDLQSAVGARKVSLTGVTVQWNVDEAIRENVKFNPSCAEKKLMTAALRDKLEFISYAVVEYPLGDDPKLLASHVGLGSSSGGSFYAPCDSCKAAYGKVLELKKV